MKIKVSLAECDIVGDLLRYRGRLWVPDSELLCTGLVQKTHDSLLTGHPGRDATAALLRRQYFWPGMDATVRRFVDNCHSCKRNTIWRQRRQGMLKPLPIPEQIWSELSLDFMTDLPESNGCTNMMVVTDRLGKGLEPIPIENLETETVARHFINRIVGYHGLPVAMVSDRGA